MRVFIAFLFCITTLFASTESKISKTKRDLSYNTKKEKKILLTLDEISKKINHYKITLQKIKNSINSLSYQIKNASIESKKARQKLKKIKRVIETLNKNKNKVNKKLVSILSKEIMFEILKNSNSINTNQDELINSYINQTYSKVLRDKFNKTKLKSLSLKLDLAYAKSEYEKLNKKVLSLIEKKKELRTFQKLKSSTLSKLEIEKKRYIKKLELIRKQNRQLTNLLKKLKILKQKEDEKRNSIILTKKNSNDIRVKRVGDTYNITPISKYNGPKTIAPFKRYKIVRKFGSFVDPNYKIKMFNPNVVLKPIGSKNVINVLDGKVISITNSPPIGYIVIVENKNGLHTLYAKLSSIAPTIKKGHYIKKGYILGKVKDELFFEVTKNNTNINPMRLIR